MANGDPNDPNQPNQPEDPLGDFPIEGQPEGSEDPTIPSEPLEPGQDPNATQAEPDEGGIVGEEPIGGEMLPPQEPGTEAEGVDEGTAEMTQEAPLVEDEAPMPDEPLPQVPAFPIDVKPKSDLYTLMLILGFLAFIGTFVLAGMQAYEHYDVQFWVFDKRGEEEPPPEEEAAGEEGGGEAAPAPAPGNPANPANPASPNPANPVGPGP